MTLFVAILFFLFLVACIYAMTERKNCPVCGKKLEDVEQRDLIIKGCTRCGWTEN